MLSSYYPEKNIDSLCLSVYKNESSIMKTLILAFSLPLWFWFYLSCATHLTAYAPVEDFTALQHLYLSGVSCEATSTPSRSRKQPQSHLQLVPALKTIGRGGAVWGLLLLLLLLLLLQETHGPLLSCPRCKDTTSTSTIFLPDFAVQNVASITQLLTRGSI